MKSIATEDVFTDREINNEGNVYFLQNNPHGFKSHPRSFLLVETCDIF